MDSLPITSRLMKMRNHEQEPSEKSRNINEDVSYIYIYIYIYKIDCRNIYQIKALTCFIRIMRNFQKKQKRLEMGNKEFLMINLYRFALVLQSVLVKTLPI